MCSQVGFDPCSAAKVVLRFWCELWSRQQRWSLAFVRLKLPADAALADTHASLVANRSRHRNENTMSFLTFITAAVVLAITPGPGIAYVVARTVAGGRAEGLASCLGTGIGGTLHVLAAALGLSLIVSHSALAFNMVKFFGAAYLIYLGIRLFLRRDQALTIEPVMAYHGAGRALFEGIVVEALNVKTALFFLAFLPQFVSPSQSLAPQLVLLGSTCVALNTLVDVIAVFAANRLLKSGGARAARARLLTRTSGLTMLGLGAYLALARR
jgi:threonine/homoserine/homoserine lactone efflux protein